MVIGIAARTGRMYLVSYTGDIKQNPKKIKVGRRTGRSSSRPRRKAIYTTPPGSTKVQNDERNRVFTIGMLETPS